MHQRFASKSDAEPGAEPGTEPATLSALAPEDTWIDGVDMGAFKKEMATRLNPPSSLLDNSTPKHDGRGANARHVPKWTATLNATASSRLASC